MVSHDAVMLIAGMIPINVIEERIQIWNERESGVNRRESKKQKETLDTWQWRLNESNKGRETYQYLPEVRTVIGIRQPS